MVNILLLFNCFDPRLTDSRQHLLQLIKEEDIFPGATVHEIVVPGGPGSRLASELVKDAVDVFERHHGKNFSIRVVAVGHTDCKYGVTSPDLCCALASIIQILERAVPRRYAVQTAWFHKVDDARWTYLPGLPA